MPSAKSTAAITVTHKPNPSRMIAVPQPFHSREVGLWQDFPRDWHWAGGLANRKLSFSGRKTGLSLK